MDCTVIESELVSFHFATVDLPMRGAVESHLPTCAKCMRTFLQIKRECESEVSTAAPSPLARARLRSAVAAEFGVPGRSVISPQSRRQSVEGHRSRWYWGGATAAAFAVAALVVVILRPAHHDRSTVPRPVAGASADVDSARPIPENLNVL